MTKTSWFFWTLVGLVWLVVSLPFTDYSPVSLFDIPDSPPRSHDGLWKLLENITYAGNFSLLSVVLLYGLNRGWYRGNGYPKWLRSLNLQERFTKIFDDKMVRAAANALLGLLGLVSSVLFFLHGRILGRGLGYW
jgi:hypothetical protein